VPEKLSFIGRRLDLEIRQGAGLPPQRFTIRHKQDGSPINLTGAEVRAAVRRGLSGPKIADLAVTVELPNVFYISLAPAAAATIQVAKATWGLEIIWSNGDVHSPVYGEFSIARDIA
jgi:hypothetical protein